MTKLRFLDVNVPMYAAGKSHRYKQSCVGILTQIEEGSINVAIDVEIIQELLYRYHSLGFYKEALELAWNLLDLDIDILELNKKDIEMALYYYQKYYKMRIPPRDALHTAVMVKNGLKEIISTDKHFDRIEEVERIDPMDL